MISSHNSAFVVDEKVEFINRFYLYKGLATYVKNSGIESNLAKFSIDHDEVNLMRHFNCSPEWPICLFDFSYVNRCPTYFCFRVAYDLTSVMKHDYFTTDYIKSERNKNI